MDKFNDELTNLLVDASVHYLHLTLETLPVGRIEICRLGIVKAIDDWTESVLGFCAKDLVGSHLNKILGEKAQEVLEASKSMNYGKVTEVELQTKGGGMLNATIVLVPALRPYYITFEIIFA